MVRLDAVAVPVGGATLVGAVVALPAAVDGRRRVRLADETGGPLWPPRRRGAPAAGWDDAGVTVALDPGERRAVGYATPAPPADPPLTVAGVDTAGRATGADRPAGPGDVADGPDDETGPSGAAAVERLARAVQRSRRSW